MIELNSDGGRAGTFPTVQWAHGSWPDSVGTSADNWVRSLEHMMKSLWSPPAMNPSPNPLKKILVAFMEAAFSTPIWSNCENKNNKKKVTKEKMTYFSVVFLPLLRLCEGSHCQLHDNSLLVWGHISMENYFSLLHEVHIKISKSFQWKEPAWDTETLVTFYKAASHSLLLAFFIRWAYSNDCRLTFISLIRFSQ